MTMQAVLFPEASSASGRAPKGRAKDFVIAAPGDFIARALFIENT